MKTLEQILTEKGYGNEEIQEIVYEYPNFDEQVRTQYGIDEPIHLYESYYLGDADEEELNKTALFYGLDSYIELLAAMDGALIDLAYDYPTKTL